MISFASNQLHDRSNLADSKVVYTKYSIREAMTTENQLSATCNIELYKLILTAGCLPRCVMAAEDDRGGCEPRTDQECE